MSTETSNKGRIVVGTDGSQRAEKAVRWAAERAQARGLPLTVLYALPEVVWTGSMARNVATNYQAEYEKEGLAKVEAVTDKFKGEFPGLDVAGELVNGDAARALAKASKEAEMVVVGARGHSAPLSVKLLGGVTDAIAAHSHCPIAVITDEAHENPEGPIVVGVDDSAAARDALKLAFEAADLRGVPVVAVHGYTLGPPTGSNLVAMAVEQYRADAEKMVNEVLADQVAKYPDVPVEVRIVSERGQDAVVEASKDAGMVVMGSRGRGGFKGLLLGSTSKHVLREAHCPVVITRG